MIRVYECRNVSCDDFGRRVIIRGRPLDSLYEFPTVVCGCGCAPMIVDPPVIDGGTADQARELGGDRGSGGAG